MRKKENAEPKQKRSIATKNRIKETAKQLFVTKGYDNITSNHIAAEAKVPIGSFYNYFGNKKGLLLELLNDFSDNYYRDTIGQFDEAIKEITSKEIAIQVLKPLIKNSVSSLSLRDPFFKVILALQFSDSDVLAFSKETRFVEINSLTQFLEIVHQFHPQKNIHSKARLLHILLENVATHYNQTDTDFNPDQLIEETTVMFYKYLFLDD